MVEYHIYDGSGFHHDGPYDDEDEAHSVRNEHEKLYDGTFYVQEE